MLHTIQFYKNQVISHNSLDLQYILEGIQGEGQDEALFALGKPAELTLRWLCIF